MIERDNEFQLAWQTGEAKSQHVLKSSNVGGMN